MDTLIEPILADESEIKRLNNFLVDWEKNYLNKIAEIPLFDTEKTKQWPTSQKAYFAKTFYHARGHFYNFLWYMGNFAPNINAKQMILDNIAEEFGGNGKSHEQMYFDFASEMGACLKNEYLKRETYLPFLKEFNDGHLEWLDKHDWDSRLAAFSAYEKLDNVDYDKLLKLAVSLGASKTGQVFFIVHNHAEHFERIADDLINIWLKKPEKVQAAFSFIFEHQLKMWRLLSNCIFNYS